jgi:choline dehydrogenase
VTALLIEAGGDDELPAVADAARWVTNLGSERDWLFQTRPAPQLNGRSLTVMFMPSPMHQLGFLSNFSSSR